MRPEAAIEGNKIDVRLASKSRSTAMKVCHIRSEESEKHGIIDE